MEHVDKFDFDGLPGNFDNLLGSGAKRIVRASADRRTAWTRGALDDLL
ncbi:MAG: hypothetical protein LH605_08035 [Microbacteriaceae bacterium]|nr:hypothetical protein [Microbacteriaceae bacterium]